MKLTDPSLVFATSNQNKLMEVQNLLGSSYKIYSLKDIGCDEDIRETSPSISGNALQKAKYVKENYGYNCFADDTGLEVDALDGDPGVYSARYAGPEKDDRKNVAKLLDEMSEKQNRRAQFTTVIALVTDDEEICFTGICPGQITRNRRGSSGFGYDPVFIPSAHKLTFAEMSLEEKSKISHRGIAMQKLMKYLLKKGG